MKKLFYLFLVVTFLQSCEEKSDVYEDNNTSSQIALSRGTYPTGGMLNTLGVDEILVSEANNTITYELISNNSLKSYVKGEQFKLSDYSFTIQDNKFSSPNIPNLYLKWENDTLFLGNEALNTTVDINSLSDLDVPSFILFTVYMELKEASVIDSTETSQLQTLSTRPCSGINQIGIVGIGLTQAGAVATLEFEECRAYNDGALDGCWAIDEKPLTSKHLMFHFALRTWCCDGTNSGSGGCW